jgi:hypothetical protein
MANTPFQAAKIAHVYLKGAVDKATNYLNVPKGSMSAATSSRSSQTSRTRGKR